jgi:hypothetical protein
MRLFAIPFELFLLLNLRTRFLLGGRVVTPRVSNPHGLADHMFKRH